jgi:hypothetical protein
MPAPKHQACLRGSLAIWLTTAIGKRPGPRGRELRVWSVKNAHDGHERLFGAHVASRYLDDLYDMSVAALRAKNCLNHEDWLPT